MNTYIHSVSLDANKCTGCTTCMKHCPTEAIRIRNGCAEIDAERCIDCGECIRNCPNNAKKSICNTLDEISRFKYKIALPAPALMAQFDNLDSIERSAVPAFVPFIPAFAIKPRATATSSAL